MVKKVQITENDIRTMVSESIKRVLNERYGAISDNFLPLAQYISDNATEEKQKISEVELKKYFDGLDNYPEIVFPLYFQKVDLPNEISAQYNVEDNTLYLNKNLDASTPDIMHELTHFINHLGNISMDEPDNLYGGDSKDEENANYIFYLFKKTEINARLSEFAYYIKENGLNGNKLSDYEDILFISEMQNAIDYISSNRKVLYMLLNIYKSNNLNISNTGQLLHLLDKILHNYKQKAGKILYNAIQNQ